MTNDVRLRTIRLTLIPKVLTRPYFVTNHQHVRCMTTDGYACRTVCSGCPGSPALISQKYDRIFRIAELRTLPVAETDIEGQLHHEEGTQKALPNS